MPDDIIISKSGIGLGLGEVAEQRRSIYRKKYKELNNKINEIQEEYSEKLYSYIKIIVSNNTYTDKEKEILIDLFYEALEKVYSISKKEFTKIFQTKININIKNIKDLFYKEDGKTLEERISEYYEEAKRKANDKIKPELICQYLFNMNYRILDTEIFNLKLNIKRLYRHTEYKNKKKNKFLTWNTNMTLSQAQNIIKKSTNIDFDTGMVYVIVIDACGCNCEHDDDSDEKCINYEGYYWDDNYVEEYPQYHPYCHCIDDEDSLSLDDPDCIELIYEAFGKVFTEELVKEYDEYKHDKERNK